MPKKKTKKKSFKDRSNVGAFFISVIAIFCFTAIIVGGYVFINALITVNGDPAINLDTAKDNQNQTSFLYATDTDGKQVELLTLHGTENRIWVDLEDISQNLRDAFICLEDKRFNEHHGVDWIRTIGVMVKPSNSGQGGSTITQQLVKNITGNNEVTYVRKYNEILTALNLEKNFSKDQILEAYLNTVYLGQGCYGVETAAEIYFGKTASELTDAECAVIASITQNPYKYDPINYPDKNRGRQETCLWYMHEQGKLTDEEYQAALDYDLIFTTDDDYVPSEAQIQRKANEEKLKNSSGFQSYYVDYVIEDVIERLQDTLGYSEKDATNAIYGGGLRIYTAVDLEIQKKVEKIYVNKTNWLDKAAQSSCTVMGYDGRVVAIVGGAGEKEGNRVLNRATQSPRPPGSTIKPLSTYAPGIEEDEITWSTYIKDYAIYYNGSYWPHNFSGNNGSGSYYTVQNALAQSLNTIPARIVVNMLGTEKAYDYVKNKFHISTVVDGKDNNPAPLVVGSMTYGCTTLDMCAAYCSFGNGGKYYRPYSFYYITDAAGNVLIDNRNVDGEQILSESTAEVMLHMLQTVTTQSSGTGYNYKTSGFDNYAKTGTTDDNKDKWMIGGTPYYCTAIWYGYDTPETIYTNGNPAGTIYRTVMNSIHEDLAYKDFEYNDKAEKHYYCTDTGRLASSSCSSAVGWYKADSEPGYCSGHYYYSDDSEDEDVGSEEVEAEATD